MRRIVDWERVGSLPLRLSALSLKERLYHYNMAANDVVVPPNFHVAQSDKFQDELLRLDQQSPRLNDHSTLTIIILTIRTSSFWAFTGPPSPFSIEPFPD